MAIWTNLTSLIGLTDRTSSDSNSSSDYNLVKNSIKELAGNGASVPDKTVQENADDIAALQANPSLPYGYIQGLEISNGTDTDHQIDIATGQAKDSTGVQDIISDSVITIDIEDSGVNGLDTGTVAADTFYYIWLIYNPTTDTEAGLFSLSATSPTMPSGYTYKRRVRGAIMTDLSNNIRGFTQTDGYFHFKLPITDLSTTSPGTSKTNLTISVPPNMRADIRVIIYSGTAAYGYVMNVSDTDYTPTVTKNDWHVGTDNNRVTVSFQKLTTDSSSQISYRHTVSSPVANFVIETIGFFDNAEI